MNIVIRKSEYFDLLEIHGRIDGITAAEIKHTFDQVASDGVRTLVADLKNVTYLSSAGLRVILQTHKSFQLIGGRLVLVSVPVAVNEVFRISGMDKFLVVYPDIGSFHEQIKPPRVVHAIETLELEGIRFERLRKGGVPGRLFRMGSMEKLDSAGYHRYDVIRVKQAEMKFGAGLGVLGDEYGDFHNLFGESISLSHHFFSYPAVPHPFVDYSIFSAESGHLLNFLQGFGFGGEFNEVLHFETTVETPTLENLMLAAAAVATTDVFGVVLLSVSGGILGMHLKKSPVLENQPVSQDIFSADNFADWISYPLEEEDIHKTIVAAGVVKKPKEVAGQPPTDLFPAEGGMHLHAAVFENGLWSVDPEAFEAELNRIVEEFEVEKVVHLLPASRLKSGFIGIINLEPI